MTERRAALRSRTILGGTISFNKGRSSIDCTVCNFSTRGARIAFTDTALFPDVFDLAILRKEVIHRARLIWCTDSAAGLAFVDHREDSVIPLASVSRLRALQAQSRARLQRTSDGSK